MKPCPYCAELIQDQAVKCRYCGEWLDPSKRPAWSQEARAAAAAATAPLQGSLDDDDDPPRDGPGSTLPVGSGVPELGRREPEPPRTWSAPAWLANAQAARVEPREELPPTDRSTLEEVALRMERIRQSAAAVRESAEPPRAVRPTERTPERATLEVEPGVTLPAGSLRALGLEPREPAGRRGAEPARAMPAAPKPAPVVRDEELADFDDDDAPRVSSRPYQDDQLSSSERPTVPDIPREQLMAEADAGRRRKDAGGARAERGTKHVVAPEDLDAAVAPTERVHKRKAAAALPPEPELPGPPTERVPKRKAGTADSGDDIVVPTRKSVGADRGDAHAGPTRRLDAPTPAPVLRDDDDEDDDELDDFDDAPPPRAAGAGFDDDFLDEDGEEGDEGDEGGYEDFGQAGPAPRPLPWRPILIAAAVVVVLGVVLFRDFLFPSDPEGDEVAAEGEDGGAAPEGEGQPEAKATPAPAPTQAAGEGQPVQPEAKADAGTATDTPVADPGQPPAPAQPPGPAPSADDPLAKAKAAYAAANGKPAKLAPVATQLQEILAKTPDDPAALTLMAQVQLEQNKMDDALKTANRCTEVSPVAANCWLTIGVIQETKGATMIAKPAYQKYLELSPDGSYAKEVRKALGRLK